MKQFFIILLIFNAFLNADINIDMQINKIRNAPASERVQLMNAFKQRVFQMNREERSVAIRKIQTKLYSKKSQKSVTQVREMKIQEMREHASELQMKNSDDITNYQNMNQQQIKNLIAHEKMERKEGKISKVQIVNQILKIEKEKQDIRIPVNKIIKQIKKPSSDYIKEQVDVQVPTKQEIKQIINQIKEVQVPSKEIQEVQAPSPQVYINEPEEIQAPILNYTKEK